MKKFLSSGVYKKVLNTVSDAIFIVDLKTQKITFFNQAAVNFSQTILKKSIRRTNSLESLFRHYSVLQDQGKKSVATILREPNFGTTEDATVFTSWSSISGPKLRLHYQLFRDDETHLEEEPSWGVLSVRKVARTEVFKKNTRLFIKTIGHELKQPLGLIKAYTYYLERHFQNDSSDAKKYPKSINNQINVVVQMLNDIVDTSRMSLQSLEVHPEAVEVEAFLKKIVTDLQSADPHREFALLSHGEVTGFFDRGRMSQVVTNLLLNAMKYSDETAPITIELRTTKRWIVIAVQDQGMGIDRDELPYIFEPYFRSRTTRQKARGLGLGLALAKEIVMQHGGTITVKSELGEGSIFSIRLPRNRKEFSLAAEKQD